MQDAQGSLVVMETSVFEKDDDENPSLLDQLSSCCAVAFPSSVKSKPSLFHKKNVVDKEPSAFDTSNQLLYQPQKPIAANSYESRNLKRLSSMSYPRRPRTLVKPPRTSHSSYSTIKTRPYISNPTNFRRVSDSHNFDGTLKFIPLTLSFELPEGKLPSLPDFNRLSLISASNTAQEIKRPDRAMLRQSITLIDSPHSRFSIAEETDSPLLIPDAFNCMLPGLTTSEAQKPRYSLQSAPYETSASYLISLPTQASTPPPRSYAHSHLKYTPNVPPRHPGRVYKFSTSIGSTSSAMVRLQSQRGTDSTDHDEPSNPAVDSEIAELNAHITARRQSALLRAGLAPTAPQSHSLQHSQHSQQQQQHHHQSRENDVYSALQFNDPHHRPAIAPSMRVHVRSETLSDIGSALSVPLTSASPTSAFFASQGGNSRNSRSSSTFAATPELPSRAFLRDMNTAAPAPIVPAARAGTGNGVLMRSWKFPWAPPPLVPCTSPPSAQANLATQPLRPRPLALSRPTGPMQQSTTTTTTTTPPSFYNITAPPSHAVAPPTAYASYAPYMPHVSRPSESTAPSASTRDSDSDTETDSDASSFYSATSTESLAVTGLRKRGMSVAAPHGRGESVDSVDSMKSVSSVESMDSIGSSILEMDDVGVVKDKAVRYRVSQPRRSAVGMAV